MRNSGLIFGLYFAAVLLPDGARAQEANCEDPQTQMEMNQCAYLDLEKADKQLNATYLRARVEMRRIDRDLDENMRGAEKALLKGQRAWITYRDGACEAEGYAFHRGSMESLIIASCKARLTRMRQQDLLDLLEPK